MRCHRGAEAILVLDDAGYSVEAASIRRSVIEHGVALNWLAAEGDKIADKLARGHAHGAGQIRRAVADAGWTSVDVADIDATIADIKADSRERRGDNMLQFVNRVLAYGWRESRKQCAIVALYKDGCVVAQWSHGHDDARYS
jgi:hypothetical protein